MQIRKKPYLSCVVSSIILLCACNAAHANLVLNGDFDNIGNVFVNNTGLGSDDLQTPGATMIPSWSAVPGFANDFWTAPVNSYGLSASPGNGSGYFVDLTGQANNKPYGGIEQSISTVAGKSYILTFDLGASTLYNGSGLASAALFASAGGTIGHFTLTPTTSDQWASESLSFTAQGTSTNVRFLGDSAFTSQYTGLDNVSVGVVSGVPEPSTWAMMLIGFGGLGFLAYSRAKKVDVGADIVAI